MQSQIIKHFVELHGGIGLFLDTNASLPSCRIFSQTGPFYFESSSPKHAITRIGIRD